MTKDGFWSGMFFGGLVGVAFTLMLSNKIAAEVVEAENEQSVNQESDNKGFLSELIDLYNKDNRSRKEKGEKKTQTQVDNGNEDVKKSSPDKGQTEEQGKKKNDDKLNVNEKITKLEEALKELREEKN